METTVYVMHKPDGEHHSVLTPTHRMFGLTIADELTYHGLRWRRDGNGLGATFPHRLRAMPPVLAELEVTVVTIAAAFTGVRLQPGSATPPNAAVDVTCEPLEGPPGSPIFRSTVRVEAPTLELANELYDQALTGKLELAHRHPMPQPPVPGADEIERIDIRNPSRSRPYLHRFLQTRLDHLMHIKAGSDFATEDGIELLILATLVNQGVVSRRVMTVELEETSAPEELERHMTALATVWPQVDYLVRIAPSLIN